MCSCQIKGKFYTRADHSMYLIEWGRHTTQKPARIKSVKMAAQENVVSAWQSISGDRLDAPRNTEKQMAHSISILSTPARYSNTYVTFFRHQQQCEPRCVFNVLYHLSRQEQPSLARSPPLDGFDDSISPTVSVTVPAPDTLAMVELGNKLILIIFPPLVGVILGPFLGLD